MLPPGNDSTLADWLSWQEQLHPKSIALGLDRVRAVAQRLHLPDAGIRTLTVAGTNGKGSSTTLLGEIYRAAGYRVGVYTSPHLLRYNERVAVDGRPVSDRDLCRAFSAIEAARGATLLTYFEFGTLAALWLFREVGAHVQVLEVGLGGRLDAVNIVDADAVLITNVGLDHTDWLGNDREAIAYEKAGVLRAGRPAVCMDRQPPQALATRAAELAVPMQWIGREFDGTPAADAWHWRGVQTHYKKLPLPGLPGAHQLQNAAGVLAAVETMQSLLPVPEPAIRSALPRLHLPGRFERCGPFLLDVAHNAEAAQSLRRAMEKQGLSDAILVLGMLSDKPVEAFCEALAPVTAMALFASLPGPRGLSSAQLQARGAASFKAHERHDTVAEALVRARALSVSGQTILVCGSFLTVAAAVALVHG